MRAAARPTSRSVILLLVASLSGPPQLLWKWSFRQADRQPEVLVFSQGPLQLGRSVLPTAGRWSSSAVARFAQDEDRSSETKDWREFRAKLVRSESVSEGREVESEGRQEPQEERGWAHATPVIETGSLLLSAPGDHFAINQQYFHKTMIFIVEHTADFTKGVILN
ncbi:unnamed protein product, partial [Polarella glacialis]